VTAGFSLAFLTAVGVQVGRKFRAQAEAKRAGKQFERYAGTNRDLVVVDRVVANFTEWAPHFYALFWSALAVRPDLRDSIVKAGWLYVACRVGYVFVGVYGNGLGRMGAKAPILLTTFPAYGSLAYFLYAIFSA